MKPIVHLAAREGPEVDQAIQDCGSLLAMKAWGLLVCLGPMRTRELQYRLRVRRGSWNRVLDLALDLGLIVRHERLTHESNDSPMSQTTHPRVLNDSYMSQPPTHPRVKSDSSMSQKRLAGESSDSSVSQKRLTHESNDSPMSQKRLAGESQHVVDVVNVVDVVDTDKQTTAEQLGGAGGDSPVVSGMVGIGVNIGAAQALVRNHGEQVCNRYLTHVLGRSDLRNPSGWLVRAVNGSWDIDNDPRPEPEPAPGPVPEPEPERDGDTDPGYIAWRSVKLRMSLGIAPGDYDRHLAPMAYVSLEDDVLTLRAPGPDTLSLMGGRIKKWIGEGMEEELGRFIEVRLVLK